MSDVVVPFVELQIGSDDEPGLMVGVCPVCTVHYTPDPSVGDGRAVCPVCETRRQCEKLMGQFMTLLAGKRDKKKSQLKRIIIPGRSFNGGRR